jgi:nucleotide-binding universal stress UspA family protein
LFGDRAEYWAVNVQAHGAGAMGAAPTTFPAMYGGSLVGYGGAYPFVAPDPYAVRGVDGAEGEVDGASERAEATAGAAVEQAGMSEAERLGEVGEPVEAILRSAHDHGIDVIVVGDHDRSWWSRLFSPDVGSQLVERAELPVLVVSRDAAMHPSHEPAPR